MKRVLALLLVVIAVGLLSSCNASLEDQQKSWNSFVAKNQYGSASDVWLVKHNALGQMEKVAVIFGYMNDYEFCTDIAGLYMQKYPLDTYSCSLAN